MAAWRVTSFDLGQASHAIRGFDARHLLAFGTFWAQRLWPMYELFVVAGGPGNPTRVQRCLDLAWSAAAGARPTPQDLDSCQHELQHLAPDIDSGVLAYAAMESAASAWDCLDAIRQPSVRAAIRPAEAFAQVIEAYLRHEHPESELAGNERETVRHDDDDIWIPHIEALRDLVLVLGSNREIDISTIDALRMRARDRAVDHLVRRFASVRAAK